MELDSPTLTEFVSNVQLDLPPVPQPPTELLAYQDSTYQLHLLLVPDAHHLLLLVHQLLPSNHVYQPSMLPQLPDLMLPVLLAQPPTTLLNVTMLNMLPDVNQDSIQSTVLVLLAQLTLFHVVDKPSFNVMLDSI